MKRKIFMSFLGALKHKPYDKVIYEYNKQRYETQFAPEATLKLLCKDFKASNGDKVIFFLTKDAEKISWQNYTYEINNRDGSQTLQSNIGLYNRIKEDFGEFVHTEIIDEGKNEDEIWKVFDVIYKHLQDDDEVVFDVTFGFRTNSILLMSLINYAKVMNNITIRGIYYGAYEAKIDNVTPIWNLASFSELQSWAVAANDFINYGFPQKLIEVVQDDYETLKNTLVEVVESIETNRGRRIVEGKIFEDLQLALEQLPHLYPPPLTDLVQKIRQVANKFGSDKDWKNGLAAVEWCIDNGMTQQGITILDELIVTYLCRKHFPKKNKAYENNYKRGIISKCLFVKNKNLPESKWHPELFKKIHQTRHILQNLPDDLSEWAARLSTLRNDINHSGYTKNQNPAEFKEGLKEIFAALQPLLEENEALVYATEKIPPPLPPFFINLSNHPSGLWKKHQKVAAQKWGEIVDLPFPNIPPEWSDEQVENLAAEYLGKCMELAASKNGSIAAIHLMGEMTFTFWLVQRLKQRGIPVLASTTERQTTQDENGNKVTVFNFIRFRKY